MRQLAVATLAEKLGAGTLLADVLPKLRCHRCREQPRSVKLSDGGGPRRLEVWLSGPAE
jgi:hypothetical protein